MYSIHKIEQKKSILNENLCENVKSVHNPQFSEVKIKSECHNT